MLPGWQLPVFGKHLLSLSVCSQGSRSQFHQCHTLNLQQNELNMLGLALCFSAGVGSTKVHPSPAGSGTADSEAEPLCFGLQRSCNAAFYGWYLESVVPEKEDRKLRKPWSAATGLTTREMQYPCVETQAVHTFPVFSSSSQLTP